jgi:hypothetical protein
MLRTVDPMLRLESFLVLSKHQEPWIWYWKPHKILLFNNSKSKHSIFALDGQTIKVLN